MVAVQLIKLVWVLLFQLPSVTGLMIPSQPDLRKASCICSTFHSCRARLGRAGTLFAEPETTQSSSTSSSSITTNDDDAIVTMIREAVFLAGGEAAWEESAQFLAESVSMLGTKQVTEQCLADAFGWKAWAKASERTKKFHRPKVPDPEKLKDALAWLRDGPLALNDEQVKTSILKAPKTYLDAPNESFRKSLGTAPRKYRDNLIELIRLDPSVLEVTYNCDGEGCASECGRCWVSYENRLPTKETE